MECTQAAFPSFQVILINCENCSMASSYPSAFSSLKYHLGVLFIFLSSASLFVLPGLAVSFKVGVNLTLHLSRNNVPLGTDETSRKGSMWNCKYHQRNR